MNDFYPLPQSVSRAVAPAEPRVWTDPLLTASDMESLYGVTGHEMAGVLTAAWRAGALNSKQIVVLRATEDGPLFTMASEKYIDPKESVSRGELVVMPAESFLGRLMLDKLSVGKPDEWYTGRMLFYAESVGRGTTVTFGRDGQSHHDMGRWLSNSKVSRGHFAITNEPERVTITDLDSRNGTLASVSPTRQR